MLSTSTINERCNRIGYTCQHCFRLDVPLKKCSRCRCAMYCSKECQQMAWKAHKGVCDFNVEGKAHCQDNAILKASHSLLEQWAKKQIAFITIFAISTNVDTLTSFIMLTTKISPAGELMYVNHTIQTFQENPKVKVIIDTLSNRSEHIPIPSERKLIHIAISCNGVITVLPLMPEIESINMFSKHSKHAKHSKPSASIIQDMFQG